MSESSDLAKEFQRKRLSEIATNRALLNQAGTSQKALQSFVLEYREAIESHLVDLLLREREVRNKQAAQETAYQICETVIREMYTLLSSGWTPKPKEQFRRFLKEAIHRAHWQRQRPENPLVAGLEHCLGQAAVQKATKELKRFSRAQNNDYFVVFCLRLENPTARPFAPLVAAKLKRPVSDAWVRQILRRARQIFLDYLIEEVRRSFGEVDQAQLPTVLRQELEVLGLLDLFRESRRYREFLGLSAN